MKKNFSGIVVVLSAALMLGGCSAYSKLVKTGDKEAMYRAALEYFEAGRYEKSLQLFQEVGPYFFGTSKEDTMMYYTGMAYYNQGDFDNSEQVFDDFRRKFGRSPFIEDAEYMYAMGFYHAAPPAQRDQTLTLQAITTINEYLERYPQSMFRQLCLSRLDELQLRLYEKEFINARTYFKTGQYKAAVIAFRTALGKYPDTPFREEMLYLTTKSSYELALNSVMVLQRDRYLDMVDSYYTFIAEYPDSEHRREMDRMLKSARSFLDGNGSEIENID